MSQFVINRPAGFESAVRAIVKQTFPAAQSSELAMKVTEHELRGAGTEISTTVAGSKRERFVWGISRMGCSRVAG